MISTLAAWPGAQLAIVDFVKCERRKKLRHELLRANGVNRSAITFPVRTPKTC